MNRIVFRLEQFLDYIFDIKKDRAQRITEALSVFMSLDEDRQDEIIKTIVRHNVSREVID